MSDSNRNRLNTIRIVFFVAAGILLLRAMDLQLIDDTYSKGGSYKFLQEKHGLTSDKIVDNILKNFK